eukprot:1159480-Pelagomonas_calceolata.AAC.11
MDREAHPKAALHDLFHKMHYPLPVYTTEDLFEERLACAPRFVSTVTLPLLETPEGIFDESWFQ